MGHTMFSVSIVQFVKGKLTVVCEKADKVGGRRGTTAFGLFGAAFCPLLACFQGFWASLDALSCAKRTMTECLMREFAAQFKKKVGCDPLTSKKAAFKLEEQVTKTKKILPANLEAQLSVECLMEACGLRSSISQYPIIYIYILLDLQHDIELRHPTALHTMIQPMYARYSLCMSLGSVRTRTSAP